MDMMYPLMYVHSVYSSMLDRMYSGMSASWSVYANNQRIDLTPEVAAEVGTGGGELKSQPFISTLIVNISCFCHRSLEFKIHMVVHLFLFIVILNLQFLVK